jgi:lipopolysaccharide export LptBFGC system permease protein LptF
VATFVLFADKLLWLLSLILRNHLDVVTSVRLLGYTLPTVSGLTLPIAFLIGCTLTFNRLSMDSEYVVFRAAGVSLGRMLVPLGVVAWLSMVWPVVCSCMCRPGGFRDCSASSLK